MKRTSAVLVVESGIAGAILFALCATSAACVRERSDFGRPCLDDAACGEGSLCLENACVARRAAGDFGESCQKPLKLRAPNASSPLAIGDVATSFGDATLDEEVATRCLPRNFNEERGLHDVVVRFDMVEESGVRVRVTADVPVSIAVHALLDPDEADSGNGDGDGDGDGDETCDARPADRCTPADARAVTSDGRTRELLVPRVGVGAHVVIVTAPASARGAVTINVELIDCPVGFMPIDARGIRDDASGEGNANDSGSANGSCVGWRAIESLPVPAVGANATVVANGLVLVGGRPLAAPAATAAFLDRTTESWSFIELTLAIASGGALPAEDGSLLIVGADERVNVASFQVLDTARLNVAEEELLDNPFSQPLDSIHLVPSRVGALALAPGLPVAFLRLSPRDRTCPTGACPEPFECVPTAQFDGSTVNLCTCIIEPCGPPPDGYSVRLDEDSPSVDVPLTSTFTFASLSSDRTLISGFADGQARLFDSPSDSFAIRPNLVHRPGAALTAVDGSNAAQSGGVGEDGELAALVELYDVDNGGSTTLPVPGAARVDHTATLAFDHLVLIGGRESAAGAGGASARTTMMDVETGLSIELEDLPEPRVEHVAVLLDDDRLLVAGGTRGDDEGAPAARSFILERVRRGRPAPPADDVLSPPEDCDFITDLALEPDEDEAEGVQSVVVGGTTAGRRDEVRTNICPLSERRDAIFRLQLDEPAHVVINVDSESNRPVWLTRGPCRLQDRVDVACGIEELELLSLDAGEWLIVVEAGVDEDETDELSPSSEFTLSVRIVGEATDVCAPDDDDPADDNASTPRQLTRPPSTDSGFAPGFSAAGALCPGDVDHILVEHPGQSMFLVVSGLDPAAVQVIPATIDQAASAAAGTPVVNPRFDEAQPLTLVNPVGDIGEGAYVVRLPAPSPKGAASRPLWEASVNPSCVSDGHDSLVTALDDAQEPAVRLTLDSGVTTHIAQCFTGDVDILPLDFTAPNAAEGDLLVSVGLVDATATLHPLNDDGTLGSALPANATETSSGVELRLDAEDVPAAGSVVTALRIERGETADDFIAVQFRRIGGPGDTCTQPIPLEPDDGERNFSTVLYTDDLDANLIGGCTGFRTPGLESFYSVSLDTGDTLVVDAVGVAGESPDVALYIVDACPAVAPDACLAGVDVGFTLEPEHLEFTNSGPSGTFLLVVDSFFGTAFDVEMAWSITRP